MNARMLWPTLAFLLTVAGIVRSDEPPGDIRELGLRDSQRKSMMIHPVYRGAARRILVGQKPALLEAPDGKELRVRPTVDFELSGDGSADAWRRADWEPLTRREADGL